jgi:hypothetical protein
MLAVTESHQLALTSTSWPPRTLTAMASSMSGSRESWRAAGVSPPKSSPLALLLGDVSWGTNA